MSSTQSTFERYASYYDALYRDKDYTAEATYVLEVAARCNPRASVVSSVLDLGCGTGRHLLAFVAQGVERCVGIDLSSEMLGAAERRIDAHRQQMGTASCMVSQGDARTVRVSPANFGVVASLFHVFSYQIEDDDAAAFLATARHHLAPDGAVVFDYWFGPAVEADPPVPRRRDIHAVSTVFTRTATPTVDRASHRVDVSYDVTVRDARAGDARFSETHRMRYWFLDEVERLASAAGLQVVAAFRSGTLDPPSDNDWNCTVCCIPS